MKTTKPMLQYLATCSKTSLQSFELARLNDRANLRKQMIEILDELIEMDIQARIAEWMLAQRCLAKTARTQRRIRRDAGSKPATLSLPFLSSNMTEELTSAETAFATLEQNPLMRTLCAAFAAPPASADRAAALAPPVAPLHRTGATKLLARLHRANRPIESVAPVHPTSAINMRSTVPSHSAAGLPDKSRHIA
jgi:hypothetical protein